MSEIKRGDTVMILRVHCSQTEYVLGAVRAVVDTAHDNCALRCEHCGGIFAEGLPHARVGGAVSGWLPVAWLMKIDPLAEPEHVRADEEITA